MQGMYQILDGKRFRLAVDDSTIQSENHVFDLSADIRLQRGERGCFAGVRKKAIVSFQIGKIHSLQSDATEQRDLIRIQQTRPRFRS